MVGIVITLGLTLQIPHRCRRLTLLNCSIQRINCCFCFVFPIPSGFLRSFAWPLHSPLSKLPSSSRNVVPSSVEACVTVTAAEATVQACLVYYSLKAAEDRNILSRYDVLVHARLHY
jgi:hypothetical protein